MKTFEQALQELINQYSMENGSDTPDFILAEYMHSCLVAFSKATKQRDDWYVSQELSQIDLDEMHVQKEY